MGLLDTIYALLDTIYALPHVILRITLRATYYKSPYFTDAELSSEVIS